MTRLFVLGSGSKGNAFAIETGHGVLLIEAGFGPRVIHRRAEAAGLRLLADPGAPGPGRVLGILLTHEHGDHASGALALAAQHDAPILCTGGTWGGLGAADGILHERLRPGYPLAFGAFTVHSCLTTHDAAEPVSLAIETPDGHRIAFATDVGRGNHGLRYLLQGANALVVESNYDDLMLRTGCYPPTVQQRIAGAGGHLSNRAAADLLGDLVHPGLGAIVLVHLSQQCNTAERARETVEPVLRARRYGGTLHVAEQDRPLDPISVRGAPGRDQGELPLQWDGASPARSGSASPGR